MTTATTTRTGLVDYCIEHGSVEMVGEDGMCEWVHYMVTRYGDNAQVSRPCEIGEAAYTWTANA